MTRKTTLSVMGMALVFCARLVFAEAPATVSPFGDLPADVQVKMGKLAQLLAEAVQSGRLSETQIRSQLNGGNAPAMINSLGPQAAQLLQDIAAAFKEKYTDDELNMLLGGLLGAK